MPTISERPDQADQTAPFPDAWKKTVSELMAERRTITPQELEWARAYDRAQLRSWARFPRDAEIYEAIADTTINYVTYWQAPFTGGNTGRLRRGTRVRVTVYPHDPEPIDVQAETALSDRKSSVFALLLQRLASAIRWAGRSRTAMVRRSETPKCSSTINLRALPGSPVKAMPSAGA